MNCKGNLGLTEMNYSFDLEWKMTPLSSGGSGQAYKGTKGAQKVFLKRNTTPFLAAVSVEGIAPKMLWTKRTAHGEVLTAQEWIDGQTLTPERMTQYDVLAMVKYIHQSLPLRNMLVKIQGNPMTPFDLLAEYEHDLQTDLRQHTFLNQVYDYLYDLAQTMDTTEYSVCHGDLSHTNFLLEKQSPLYLVDWESAKLADPFLDIASILCQYVAYFDWNNWVITYGITITPQVTDRLKWYCIYTYLMQIKKHHFYGRNYQVNYAIMMIKKIL